MFQIIGFILLVFAAYIVLVHISNLERKQKQKEREQMRKANFRPSEYPDEQWFHSNHRVDRGSGR